MKIEELDDEIKCIRENCEYYGGGPWCEYFRQVIKTDNCIAYYEIEDIKNIYNEIKSKQHLIE